MHPEATKPEDLKGRTPLHYALASAASNQVKLNEEKSPKQTNLIFIDGDDFDVNKTDSSEVSVDLTPAVIRILVSNGASTYRDENGMLPCHYACRYLSLAPDSLKVLVETNSQALIALDNLGRPPIHIVMGNADKPNAVTAMATLIKHDRTKIMDIPLKTTICLKAHTGNIL